MINRRTPWWYFLVALGLGLFLGIVFAKSDEITGLSLVGAPWIVAILLIALGAIVLILALHVHQYATTDPARRRSWIDPTKAVYTLVLCKALGMAGAGLAGWYCGQLLLTLAHFDAPFYRDASIQCVVTALICLADMVIGIVGEWLCQLPPNDGPESPKIKAAKRLERQRKIAAGSLGRRSDAGTMGKDSDR
ncbi:DUF3180 domain-containing protein [Bifidobacterium sp. ESL0763]|uniref:DUF3180 domain-containing protein n=1 Tax=Bifidobacterium sp. ESL0763 TaxID=2983227 RepID=UPI0023F6DE16|nr:DUF3180 domain-containing protein [Bifidobacterium sp. ESL0763]MDF7663536.1 DUF3180 domain-containing protein [Bifidobacterium sp. ESL0763]